jgi:hypothetical protein
MRLRGLLRVVPWNKYTKGRKKNRIIFADLKNVFKFEHTITTKRANDMENLTTVKASEIINKYGVSSTGEYFQHEELGEVCVCIAGNGKAGLGCKTEEGGSTVQLVAWVEFDGE